MTTHSTGKDIAIPIAFPDYLIQVDFELPSFHVPGIGRLGGQRVPTKLPQLGHAGVLFINGARGTTKYYEYGRYAPSGALGRVRKQPMPDVVMGTDGHPTRESLLKTLTAVSNLAGQKGRIEGAYIVTVGKYETMLQYALKREAENANPSRKAYDLTGNSCMHFAKSTVEATGTMLPSGLVPSPADWIEDVQDRFPDLVFTPRPAEVTIRFSPAEAVGVPGWAMQKSWIRGFVEGDW